VGVVILETFRRLQEQGRTIVLITHEHDVAAYADRTVHLRDGLVVSHEEAAAHDATSSGKEQR
jgi:putative ABC transport system ATP-binding protein